MKKRGMIICVILLFLLATFFAFRILRDPLTLRKINTEEAKALKQDVLEEYAYKVKIRYRAFNHIQIDCTNEDWAGEDIVAIADMVTDSVGQAEFQQAYAEVYQRRCKTEDASPKSLMIYLYCDGESIPEYTISSMYPFTEWTKVG